MNIAYHFIVAGRPAMGNTLMLYVMSFCYTSMRMVRYYSFYTVVTYDICVMASVGR